MQDTTISSRAFKLLIGFWLVVFIPLATGYDNDSLIIGPFVLLMHFMPLRYPLLWRRGSFGELPSSSADVTPLFRSEKRYARLTERGLGYLVKKYAEQATLRDVSPHDLRHRFGYRMAASVPLHRLAQLMRHDSLDTTMLYVQATQSDLQKEVEKIAWV